MSIFQIVQMDAAAAKWLGFAQQQCKRIMSAGTQDFYREWVMGDGSKVKAKSYGGMVKLWFIKTGARIISIASAITPTDGNYHMVVEPAKVIPPDPTIPAQTSMKLSTVSYANSGFVTTYPVWFGLPKVRHKNWVCGVTATTAKDSGGNTILTVPLISLNDRSTSKLTVDVTTIDPNATGIQLDSIASVADDTIFLVYLLPTYQAGFISKRQQVFVPSPDIDNDGYTRNDTVSSGTWWIQLIFPGIAYVTAVRVVNGALTTTRINFAYFPAAYNPSYIIANTAKNAFGAAWYSATEQSLAVVHVTDAGVLTQKKYFAASDVSAIVVAAGHKATNGFRLLGDSPFAYRVDEKQKIHVTDLETYVGATVQSSTGSPYEVSALLFSAASMTYIQYIYGTTYMYITPIFYEGRFCTSSASDSAAVSFAVYSLIGGNLANYAYTESYTGYSAIIGASPKAIYFSATDVSSATGKSLMKIDLSTLGISNLGVAMYPATLPINQVIATPDADFLYHTRSFDGNTTFTDYLTQINPVSTVNTVATALAAGGTNGANLTYCYIPEQRVLLGSKTAAGGVETTRFAVSDVDRASTAFIPRTNMNFGTTINTTQYFQPWNYISTPQDMQADWMTQTAGLQPAP